MSDGSKTSEDQVLMKLVNEIWELFNTQEEEALDIQEVKDYIEVMGKGVLQQYMPGESNIIKIFEEIEESTKLTKNELLR